jgi:hypothetical protein
MAMTMPVVAALAPASVRAGLEVAVEPGLHKCGGISSRHADEHFDAGGCHALPGASAHAASQEKCHALSAEPVGPAARLGLGRHDRCHARNGAKRPIDLEEANLGRAAEMEGELVVLGEREGDDHKK